jgi:hypothetical protein
MTNLPNPCDDQYGVNPLGLATERDPLWKIKVVQVKIILFYRMAMKQGKRNVENVTVIDR